MMKVFPRTREKEKGWKLATYSALGSLVGAPVVTVIARGGFTSRPFTEVGLPSPLPPFPLDCLDYVRLGVFQDIYINARRWWGGLWERLKCQFTSLGS